MNGHFGDVFSRVLCRGNVLMYCGVRCGREVFYFCDVRPSTLAAVEGGQLEMMGSSSAG